MIFPKWLRVYGDKKYRGKCPSESMEQITFFNYIRNTYPDYGRVAIHPRNEGKRTFRQAAHHRAEGMTTGAADIIIPGSPAFICELKRIDHTKSKLYQDQIEYLKACQDLGAFVCIALGYSAAIDAFDDYLAIRC